MQIFIHIWNFQQIGESRARNILLIMETQTRSCPLISALTAIVQNIA